MSTKAFPNEAFRFFAPADLQAMTESGDRSFTGIAYSGEVITDHYLAPVGFDLATMSIPTPLPVLFGHEDDEAVGVVDTSEIGDDCRLSGRLFAEIDQRAAEIVAKAGRGLPWGMSLRIIPGAIEEVPAGVAYTLNGRNVIGPLTVFKNSRVREVSFCSVAADQRTSAAVFSGSDQLNIEVNTMADENNQDRIKELETKLNDLAAKFASAQTEAAAEKARADAAEAALQKISSDQRKAGVQELFKAMGKEYSDEAAAPYMGMNAEQFAAVKEAVSVVVSKREIPAELFRHQATEGSGDAPTFDSLNEVLRKQIAGVN